MLSFEAIEASILLGMILITITVRNRVRFKRRRNYSQRTLATALVSSMLLAGLIVGIFFTGVQSVNGAIPTYASNDGASFNATEYVTGTNTAKETYTAQNSFSNLTRDAQLNITPPSGFLTTITGGTITISEMTAIEDCREIEAGDPNSFPLEIGYDEPSSVACSFNSTTYANLTEVSLKIWVSDPGEHVFLEIRNSTTSPYKVYWNHSLGDLVSPDWHTYILPTPLNMAPNTNYYLVLNADWAKELGTGNAKWWYEDESDGSEDNYVYIKPNPTGSFMDEGNWGEDRDMTLKMRILETNSDWTQNATYSSADQVDMRVNSKVVGENNSVSFYSSPSVFVFTTNTSVVFQKNWTALFVRIFSVSSSYTVDVTSNVTVWNLTYSLEFVRGESATIYSDRGVNITSIPSSWSVNSTNPGTAVKYGNTIVVSIADNGEYLNAFVICNSQRADIDFELGKYSADPGTKVLIRFNFSYEETGLMADTVTLNGTVPEWSYEGNGWHNITYDTDSLNTAGDFILVIQVYNSSKGYAALGQVDLYIPPPPPDYLPYVVLLILGAFGSVALKRVYSARKQEWLDRQKIHRIMVVWEVFALYDQTPSEVIAEGSLADKDLVSGLFTAIKDIIKDVGGATLETMKVYPNHPYYFVYTGEFYCVLILSDRPSLRLEEKLILFARVVEEKYRRVVEEKYGKSFFSGCGIPETRLDLDGEVMRIFGLIPITSLQEIVAVSLSYEEIYKLKVRDDVKKVLMTGRALTDELGKFSLEKFIQVVTNSLGDIMRAHSVVLKVLKLGLITVVGKLTIPKEKPIVLEIKPEPESVKKVEEEKKEIRGRRGEEFFEKYYESALSLEEIDPKKDIGEDERIVLKYVRSYNDQVGLGIKGDTMIEGLKKEFGGDEKKAINALKKTLKTGFLSETSDKKP